MRGFPFGALSSSERLASTKTKRPCAEREAPHASSLPDVRDLFHESPRTPTGVAQLLGYTR